MPDQRNSIEFFSDIFGQYQKNHYLLSFFYVNHSMAKANMIKNKFFLTSTTGISYYCILAASKYIGRYLRGPESASIKIPLFIPHFIKFSKIVNLVSQCSHLKVLLLSKFGSERGDFN